jgi:hypothetical protein
MNTKSVCYCCWCKSPEPLDFNSGAVYSVFGNERDGSEDKHFHFKCTQEALLEALAVVPEPSRKA